MPRTDSSLVALLDQLIPRYLRALRDAISDAEGDDRLTMQQLRCLQAIAEANDRGATTTKLAERMRVTVPTMSSTLDGLANRSLIERRIDPDSRRRVPIFITAEGARLIDRYQQIMDARHREIVTGLSAAERAALLRSLTMLTDQLDALEQRIEESA